MKRITIVSDRYTNEVFGEFEADGDPVVTMFAGTREYPAIQIAVDVADDYEVEPVFLAADDKLRGVIDIFGDIYQARFDELFGADVLAAHEQVLAEWQEEQVEAPIEYGDVM